MAPPTAVAALRVTQKFGEAPGVALRPVQREEVRVRVPRTWRGIKAAGSRRLGRVRVLQRPLTALLARDLQRLNDALATTDLAGRYWVFGGLLLGWAREGGILAHDCRDVDFALRRDDLRHLYEAAPVLKRAGFRPLFRHVNHDGVVTELTFMRRGAQFEFFCVDARDGMLVYFMYGYGPEGPVELEVEEPDQPLAPFDLVGRTWLKPSDHDLELTVTYGPWREPDPMWSYLDQPNVVRRRPWRARSYDW